METKLDKRLKARQIIAERNKNIEMLQKQLTEANWIMRCIKGGGLEAAEERRICGAKIDDLEGLIADERRAINEARAGAGDIDYQAAAERMI